MAHASPATTSPSESPLMFLWNGVKSMLYLVHPKDLALDLNDPKPEYFGKYGIPMFFILIFAEHVALKTRQKLRESEHAKTQKRDDRAATSDPKQQLLLQKSAADQPWLRSVDFYRLNDAISCSVLGTFQNVFLVLCDLVGLQLVSASYAWTYRNCRLTTVDVKKHWLLTYVVLLLGKDCAYYWAHRFFHEFHLPWAGHGVHHSGEDYNLATALRQGATQPLFGWMFYLPFALMGFNENAFAAHAQLNTLYMYWIHTDLIDRLPFGLEYIMNSPMAHRMHHRPPGNCNYAGMLIIWDRMFGTYEVEVERKDYYGLAKQPQAFNAAVMNTNHYNNMANIRNKTWFERLFARRVKANWVFDLGLLLKPIPPSVDNREKGPVREKWDGRKPLSGWKQLYLVAAFFSSLGLFLKYTGNVASLSHSRALGVGVALATQLTAVGKIADAEENNQSKAAMIAPLFLTPFMLKLMSDIGGTGN